MSRQEALSAVATVGLVRGRRVERLGAGAYVCRLGEGMAVFNLQGDVCSLMVELSEPGRPVLVAGLPAVSLAALDRLVATLEERRSPLLVTGLLPAQTAGRAVVEAAAERRMGAPVFLRYAAEWPSTTEEALRWHTAEALLLAATVLGPPYDVCAVRAGDRAISLMGKHAYGATSLLGVSGVSGVSAGSGTPASLLLLGDRGAVEAVPPLAHGLRGPDAPPDTATLLRPALDGDVPAEMAGWLSAALLLDDAAARDRHLRLVRWALGALEAIDASLLHGRPAAIGADA